MGKSSTKKSEETFASATEKGTVFSQDDVHIYFINPQEQGIIRRDSRTVRLITLPLEEQSPEVIHPAFLEAGGWVYPLIPSKTPVYRTAEKYYIFPDLSSITPGASVGLQFPENATAEERDLFENVLLTLAGLTKFPTGFQEIVEKSKGLITPTDVETDAEFTSNYELEPWEDEFEPWETKFPPDFPTTNFPSRHIPGDLGADIMIMAADGITSRPNRESEFAAYETENVEFPDLETTEEYKGKAEEISGHAASKLIDVTSKLAEYCNHYIKSAAAAASALETVQDRTSVFRDITPFGLTDATDGAMHTMGTVYEALKNAGKTLALSITNNHFLYDYRYGAEKRHVIEPVAESLQSLNLRPAKTAHLGNEGPFEYAYSNGCTSTKCSDCCE